MEDFIFELEGTQREIVESLHGFLSNFPEISPKIKYHIPFYYRKSWICYLNPVKKDTGVELAFTRGNELSNEQGLLASKDRKQILGVTFFSVQEIPFDTLQEIMMEAILLDDTTPYNVKKTKK